MKSLIEYIHESCKIALRKPPSSKHDSCGTPSLHLRSRCHSTSLMMVIRIVLDKQSPQQGSRIANHTTSLHAPHCTAVTFSSHTSRCSHGFRLLHCHIIVAAVLFCLDQFSQTLTSTLHTFIVNPQLEHSRHCCSDIHSSPPFAAP